MLSESSFIYVFLKVYFILLNISSKTIPCNRFWPFIWCVNVPFFTTVTLSLTSFIAISGHRPSHFSLMSYLLLKWKVEWWQYPRFFLKNTQCLPFCDNTHAGRGYLKVHVVPCELYDVCCFLLVHISEKTLSRKSNSCPSLYLSPPPSPGVVQFRV